MFTAASDCSEWPKTRHADGSISSLYELQKLSSFVFRLFGRDRFLTVSRTFPSSWFHCSDQFHLNLVFGVKNRLIVGQRSHRAFFKVRCSKSLTTCQDFDDGFRFSARLRPLVSIRSSASCKHSQSVIRNLGF